MRVEDRNSVQAFKELVDLISVKWSKAAFKI